MTKRNHTKSGNRSEAVPKYKYTPGPWWIDGNIITANCPDDISKDYITLEICEVFNGDDLNNNDSISAGDINLITVAPVLFEAAQDVIHDLERFVKNQGAGPDKRLETLKRAISQVTQS